MAKSDVPELEELLRTACMAHWGQVDKGGQPKILHVCRVLIKMRTPAERRVAALHDVIEDSGMVLDDLRSMGLPEEEVLAVDAITRRKDEPYLTRYIPRVARNALATRVKLADLSDNMDPARQTFDGCGSLMARYAEARRILLTLKPPRRAKRRRHTKKERGTT